MSEPFVGEIRMFGGNFAPAGWAFCAGQLLAISQNDVLFNLIGTTYGGDGQNTFALPNLQGRVPVHQGSSPFGFYVIGQLAGSETVTLNSQQIPVHTHPATASSAAGNATSPTNATWAGNASVKQFAPAGAAQMNNGALALSGGNQPHDNMLPFQSINFIISLFGIFPSQN
jgi:microcystin-dependent protein